MPEAQEEERRTGTRPPAQRSPSPGRLGEGQVREAGAGEPGRETEGQVDRSRGGVQRMQAFAELWLLLCLLSQMIWEVLII